MEVTFLNPKSPGWSGEIDRIGALLDAPNNPTIFPYHFLQVVLPHLGGMIALFHQDRQPFGVGFLFPRAYKSPSERTFTLRYHALGQHLKHHEDEYRGADQAQVSPQAITGEVEARLGGDTVVFYDPYDEGHRYAATRHELGSIDIGRPSRAEAGDIRGLHQQIWGSPPEFLYPTDIHSLEFHLGTSLVARVDNTLGGFLFGFYKFDGPPLPADWQTRFHGERRLESQTMGVLPAYRGMRIGNLLKRVQADQAWQEGIGIVTWTADPLQYPNAALNFGLLRAVAYDFFPDYYPFRNDLNRVPASRFALTWLVGSARVRGTPAIGSRALVLDLAHHHDEVIRVNDGYRRVDYAVDRPLIAIEIPADWTMLQQNRLDEAVRWREVTDLIFARYVGREPGQYIITGVSTDQERRYLIGEQVSDELWEHLGRT